MKLKCKMKQKTLELSAVVLFAVFVIQCAATNSTLSMKEMMENMSKAKCPYLSEDSIFNTTSQFLSNCTDDFNATRRATMTKMKIPPLQCNIVYDMYAALCSNSNSSKSLISRLPTIPDDQICPLLIKSYKKINNSALSYLTKMNCEAICIDFGQKYFNVCRHAAELAEINAQVNNLPPKIDNATKTITNQKTISNTPIDARKDNDTKPMKPEDKQATQNSKSEIKNTAPETKENKEEAKDGIEAGKISEVEHKDSQVISDVSKTKTLPEHSLPLNRENAASLEGSIDVENKEEEEGFENSDYTEKIVAETQKAREKPAVTHNEHDIEEMKTNEESAKDDSYFFSYFMLFCILFVIGYVGYHNKQKILAMVLEGRRGRRPQRRRPNSANYHKLDSNLEEAVSSTCDKTATNVIY